MEKVVKVGRNDPCPCESGKKYKRCCVDKGFTWVQAEDGKFFREIPLDDEMMGILELQRERFIEKHGRPPGPDDSIFDEPSERVEHEVVQTLKNIGVHPAFIYAYEKTGLLVTESNQHMIPESALDEFAAYQDEWFEIHGEDDVEEG